MIRKFTFPDPNGNFGNGFYHFYIILSLSSERDFFTDDKNPDKYLLEYLFRGECHTTNFPSKTSLVQSIRQCCPQISPSYMCTQSRVSGPKSLPKDSFSQVLNQPIAITQLQSCAIHYRKCTTLCSIHIACGFRKLTADLLRDLRNITSAKVIFYIKHLKRSLMLMPHFRFGKH